MEYEIVIMKSILVKKSLKCKFGVCFFGGDECCCSVTLMEIWKVMLCSSP